jgi:hypothetical protein
LTDLLIPLATFFGMWPPVLAALILVRVTGVPPLSMGMVGGISVLAFHWSMTNLSVAAAAAATLAALLVTSAAHVVLLYRLRPAAFLIASAALQIVFEQLWLVAPDATGGSGGRIFDLGSITFAFAIIAPILCLGLWVVASRLSRPPLDAAARTVAALGPIAGAFGVNHRLLIAGAMTVWTVSCGAWALLTTSASGIMALSNFDIGWSLVAFLIAVLASARENGAAWTGVLTASFVAIRFWLSAASNGSAMLANIFDIAFPLLILMVILLTRKRSQHGAVRA